MSASTEIKNHVREILEYNLDVGEEDGTMTITVGEVFDILADPDTMDLYDQFTECTEDADNVTGWLRNISSNYYCSEVKSQIRHRNLTGGNNNLLILRKL